MIKKTTVVFLLCTILSGCYPKESTQSATTPFQCINSQTRCELTTELGNFGLQFNVEEVLTEFPFSIQVSRINNTKIIEKTNSKNKIKISGYMEGKTMFMGKIPLFFNKVDNESESVAFIAETMLGSCSQDVMTWRLWLTIEKQGNIEKSHQTTFFIDFDSKRFKS